MTVLVGIVGRLGRHPQRHQHEDAGSEVDGGLERVGQQPDRAGQRPGAGLQRHGGEGRGDGVPAVPGQVARGHRSVAGVGEDVGEEGKRERGHALRVLDVGEMAEPVEDLETAQRRQMVT